MSGTNVLSATGSYKSPLISWRLEGNQEEARSRSSYAIIEGVNLGLCMSSAVKHVKPQ